MYGVVQGALGQVTIESEPGQGTSIRVLLPETREAPAEPMAAQAVPRGRGQRVLVVEDQADLRSSVQQALTAAGYVVTSSTADEVLDSDRDDDDSLSPDVLLTDVVMPGVSGPELARQLTARWPAVRVLYMSGYTDGMLADHGVGSDATLLLRKPFATEQLLRMVAGALADPGDLPRSPR